MSTTASYNDIVDKGFNEPYWHNIGSYCNGKEHPTSFPYRPYRRGKNRCHVCGAEYGTSTYRYIANGQVLREALFDNNTMLSIMRGHGSII
jgi:ribosomal protein S14